MLNEFEWDDFEPSFKTNASELRLHVFSQLKPVALKSIVLDGTMYCDYIKNLLEQISTRDAINIENSLNYVFQEKCNRAKTAAIKVFDHQFVEEIKLPCEDVTLFTTFD